MKNRTLVRDLIIALTLTVSGVMAVVGSGIYFYFVSTTRKAVHQNGREITEKLAEILALPLWEINTGEIQHIARAYMDQNYVDGLRIIDESGQPIFEEHKPGSHPIFREERTVYHHDVIVGAVEIAFNGKRIAEVQKNILQTMALIGFFILLAMIVGIRYLLEELLHRPLNQMYEDIEVIASGHYDHRLKSVPQQDINEIAEKVNQMAQAIQVRDQKLLQAHKKLEQKVAERTAELQQANENLKREIAKKEAAERQVNQYNQQLLKTNQELEEFTYVAAHDLQEPLRTLVSYCELLQTDLGDHLTPEAAESLEFIIGAAARMKRLLMDLLALSRAGRQEIKTALVDLNRCLEVVVGDLKKKVQESGAVIEWRDLPVVPGDPQQLARVFHNLLSNSLKFHSDAPPRIQLTAREHNDRWEIELRDNGIGIQEAYWDQIFVPFKRLHTARDYEGSGIGLAVCKKIIERLNGQISVHSQLGRGSTFTITLRK